MRACAIIPAYQAEATVGEVVRDTLRVWPEPGAVFVIDDGSTDGTARMARRAGAHLVRHPENRGKGSALRTGLAAARQAGFDVAVSLDADLQHPAAEAARLLAAESDAAAMVLGIRDLARAGAPRPNQISNRISNFFLSLFARRPFADTQCGLRRYPVRATLALGGRDDGYAFEAEILLRAVAGGMRIVETPIDVFYPPEAERVTHFDSVRDPLRIIARVVETLARTRGLDHLEKATDIPAPTVEPPLVTLHGDRDGDGEHERDDEHEHERERDGVGTGPHGSSAASPDPPSAAAG